MYKALPILLAAAGATAQSTTITTTWLAFGFENTPVASVVGADATAVTYSIGCSYSDIADGECGLAGGFTITQGASIFAFAYTDDTAASGYTADFSESASCAIEGTTRAVCIQSAGGGEANDPGVTTETITGTDMSFGTLLITAGFDKLSATAGASASGTQASATAAASSSSESGSGSAQSGSRTSAGASATGSAASATASASRTGSASGSAASAASTGGAAQFAVPVAGVAGVLVAALAL